MNISGILPPLLRDAVQALGLADAAGNLDASWFDNPIARVAAILTDSNQRSALFDALDEVLPPTALTDIPAGVKWHPLLGTQPRGNLFLTVDTSGASAVVGIAGLFAGAQAKLRVEVPAVAINGNSLAEITGSGNGPVRLLLDVPLGWTMPAQPLALASVTLSLVFAPAASPPVANVLITLTGLDLDGSGAHDVSLDPSAPGSEASALIVGLVRSKLASIAASATGEARTLVTHLVPLLGLDGSLPPFPIATLASDPGALTGWLRALVSGSPAPLSGWLAHLAGLLGADAPAVTSSTSGTSTISSVALFVPNAASSITLGLIDGVAADAVTPTLGVQIGVSLAPTGGGSAAVDASLVLFTAPLTGSAAAQRLPSASVVVRAPGGATALVAPSLGNFSIDSIRAGIAWNGSQIAPIVELDNVVMPGAGTFARLDLTNANTVIASAAAGLVNTVVSGLGGGAGAHLAALAGLVEPATDAAAPLVDFAQLATHPTQAIAALHRNALLSTTHPWSMYLAELGALLGLPGAVSGSGKPDDPWVISLASNGPIAVSLAAWNAQTSGRAADPQQLRFGLRATVAAAPVSVVWTSVLVGADLPSTGRNSVTLFANHDASVTLTPPPAASGWTSLAATSVRATFGLTAGAPAQVNGIISGLAITTPAGTINLPSLNWPFPAGFDAQNPAATLGIPVTELASIVSALAPGAFSRAIGPNGLALAVLAGCSDGDAGLPVGWPDIASVAGATLFADPAGAWRAWLAKIATTLAADGSDYASTAVAWLAALANGALSLGTGAAPTPSTLSGSGTYDEPWRLPLADPAAPIEALLWFEPDGAANPATAIAAGISAATDFDSLVAATAGASRYLGAWPDGVDPASLAQGLQSFATHLSATDGVVPATSALPAGGTWGSGTPLASAHPAQAADTAAISQILAQTDAWAAPGAPRCVLLLGPAFSDHSVWETLITAAEAKHPGTTSALATFSLRVPGVAPASIDLRPVTTIADFYSADLQDDGSGNTAALVAQIGLVVARLNALRPGAPVVLVAHSTVGTAACRYAAQNPASVKGLVTLGTPHLGAPLVPLLDATTADALRVIARWLPGGFPAGALQDAFAHLLAALDGYQPLVQAGALPVAWPYPVAAFDGSGSTDTGGVPALALGGALGGAAGVDLLASLKTALAARISAAASTAPTHLAFGLEAALPLGTPASVAPGQTSVASAGVAVRLDVGRLALQSGAAAPTRAAQALTATVSLARPGGWLSGDPRAYAGSAPPVDVRARSAQFGVMLTTNGTTLQAAPFAALHETAFHGPTAPLVQWSDPAFRPALGSVFATIGAGTDAAPGSPVATLLALLTALDIATPPASPGAAASIAADAINALTVDAIGFLKPNLATALSSGAVPGFAAAAGGGYAFAPGSLPLEALVTLSPAIVTLRTPAGTSGFPTGSTSTFNLSGSAGLTLASLQPAVTVSVNAGSARLVYTNGELDFAVSAMNATLPLVPAATSAQIKTACAAVLPPLLISSIALALIDGLLEPGNQVTGLFSLLSSPRAWLVQARSLGDGTVFDPDRINALFARIGALPAGLKLSAAGKDPTTVSLATAAPLGGVLGIAAGVALERSGHATPVATLTLATPTSGTWPNVTVTFGLTSAGLALSVTPGGQSPIVLLPSFAGAAALAGAAEKLLPAALDDLLHAVAPGPVPPLATLALDVAQALDLYDNVGGFAAHATQLAAMLNGGWLASLSSAVRTAFISAASALFNDASSPLAGALPGTIAASGNALQWNFALPGALGSGAVSASAGWDASGPLLAVGANALALANSPVAITFGGGFANGAPAFSGGLGVSLQDSLGLAVVPQLAFASGGSAGAALTLLPLGAGTSSTLAIELAPAVTLTAAAGAIAQLVDAWAIPLVADILIDATGATFATPLYTGGPSAQTLLSNAGLINVGSGPAPQKYTLKTPLPAIDAILASLLQSLPAAPVTLGTNPPLTLLIGNSGTTLGVALQGSIVVSSGSPTVSLLFGQPNDKPTTPGVQLALFNVGVPPVFAPQLIVRGIGAGFAGDGGSPLVNESSVRIGGIDGFVAFSFDLTQAKLTDLGGGLAIEQLGLPFGLLDTVTGGNPVAASLISSNAGSGSGDSAQVNPAVDIEVAYLDGTPSVSLAGSTVPIVVPVHASFGPLYIDQIDLALNGTASVSIGIDGSLSIDGLTVGVDELAVLIPVRSVLKPGDWSLDLQGLAVGFDSGPVQIAGGLRKNPGPPIEYDGMLSASIADLGLTVVGAYSRPSDAQGGYTSLFVFATLLAPLGGPPFAFVTGLAGGLGDNRELIVPDDPNQLDSFVLVAAMDDSSLANDPMGALMNMSQSIPPRRGAFWIAAGVKLTSFALVNSTVIVSIALDRGIDVEILGVSRMALPTEDTAIVSVELALRARFNSAEQILSVQAQLTDNSYLFSRDCQLTGGFALVIWYGEGQFVLTLGGYNPVFVKPPQFPDVPRLGFNWSVGSLVVIKGGAYFALTNSCVMAGGSLSATASIGPVSAWFDAYVDFLVSWDPFAYEFDIGVEIGASVSVRICFFGCVTLSMSISLGAQLQIAGPPFHGTVSIDAYVTTITVAFGDPPQKPPYITDWNVFAGKYLTAGDPNGNGVGVQVTAGLLAPEPAGAQPQPGTETQPWQVGAEFTLATATRMPASSCDTNWYGAPVVMPLGLNALDVAPMGRSAITSQHQVTLAQRNGAGWGAAQIDNAAGHFTVTALAGNFPEATWHWVDPAHLPAAARTISAISGFTIDAHVLLANESELIPISSLVTDLVAYALPLPFATTVASVPAMKAYGAAAQALAAVIAAAGTPQVMTASATILSGANVFATNRAALGLTAQGLAPLAVQALRTGRAAPPLVTPLTTGLTMEPVGLPAPVLAATLAPVTSVMLASPRLRAVLQAVATPASDAAPAQRTSVTGLLPAVLRDAPRMAPPGALQRDTVAGARLIVVPAAAAPRPTRAALPARALRHADLGAAIGLAHQQALDQAATDLIAGGVQLGAGATHLWDVPDEQSRFAFSGDGIARMVCTDRTGATLSDVEFAAAGSAAQALPAGTAMVAIQCLGAVPSSIEIPAEGPAAFTGQCAPTGETAATGWQSASTLAQIGPTQFLARGATVRIVRSHASRRNGQQSSYGTPRAADVVSGQFGVETRLPVATGTVLIALDTANASAAQNGDLALAATGGTLAASPARVVAGQRTLLLYDVTGLEAGAQALTVSVASVEGFDLSGVIGLPGRAIEWAARLAAGVPDHFVPDGALAPGGSLNVTCAGAAA